MANWAVVIGIDQYWKPEACLKGAVRDALKMREWLLDPQGGGVLPKNLALLLAPTPGAPFPLELKYDLPTRTNIRRKLEDLIQHSITDGGGERFYFYYAGHGLLSRINFENESAITTADFDDLNTDNSITLGSLYERIKAVPIRDQFFFFDACRNIPWKREIKLGEYPVPGGLPVSQAPNQYVLYATSPGLTAAEMRYAGNEGGAFTDALLRGLGGAGSAKVWDANTQEYLVRWDRLCPYVETEVERQQLVAGGSRQVLLPKSASLLFQKPLQGGEHVSEDPILTRFSENQFQPVPLEINLNPASALQGAIIDVIDAFKLQYKDGLVKQPVRFDLPARLYHVRAVAANFRMAKPGYAVELYEAATIPVDLVSTPGAPMPQRPFLQNTRGLDSSSASVLLTVETHDRLSWLEILTEACELKAGGQGRLICPVTAGMYRARLKTPEGDFSEEIIFVDSQDGPITIRLEPPKVPTGMTFQAALQRTGNHLSNVIHPSEAVGPVASAHLSTILALAGGASNEDVVFGHRLRGLGLQSFQERFSADETCGIQVMFGLEFASQTESRKFLRQTSLEILSLGVDDPDWHEYRNLSTPESISNLPGLGMAAWSEQPGTYWLRLLLPDQQPMVLITPVLPGRLTLVVVVHDVMGQFSFYH